ncbi:unnamed protein product [Pocillopora meandrina]|uniref:Chromo domain-containing protein n=1 Tax=Pocillopora meandrina TaxID=46732 RepID=A0AAU9VWL0_9CNID|nr:unnamed protein product [Pocillopora meandrina]
MKEKMWKYFLANSTEKYIEVRIVKKKKAFEKGYIPRWTEEVFTISNQQHTRPPTHKIQDYNGKDINYSRHELLKTTQDVYRIEKVIKSKGNKVLVKWKGYSDEFNSWVDKNERMDL